MLLDFAWAQNLIELCFSTFTVNNWLNFEEEAVSRGNGKAMLDKVIPTGKVHPLIIAGIERLPVITAVMTNPMPTAFEIVAKRFIILTNFSLLAILPINRPQPYSFLLANNVVGLLLVVMVCRDYMDRFSLVDCRR